MGLVYEEAAKGTIGLVDGEEDAIGPVDETDESMGLADAEAVPFARIDSMEGMESGGSPLYVRTSLTGSCGGGCWSIKALQRIPREIIRVEFGVKGCQRC